MQVPSSVSSFIFPVLYALYNFCLTSNFYLHLFFIKLWLRIPLEKSEPMDEAQVNNNNPTVHFWSTQIGLEF
jgi:hypothetical protein